MKPRIWVFSIMKDERLMTPWFLSHYEQLADRIIVWDEQSTDGTRELLQGCPKVEVREWPHRGLDDEAFLRAVNTEYKQARGHADWVIWPDCDELLYHPHILDVLAEATEDAIQATGYALIPEPENPWQGPIWSRNFGGTIYDYVKTGIRQPNYDKVICWRPEKEMTHTIGRHTYAGTFPRINGKISPAKLKLLHCHHIGGIEGTEEVNARNYDRARDKRYAWNYEAQHNKPTQVGTVAWVKDAIENNKLIDVMAIPDYPITSPRIESVQPLKRIQFGCGGNKLPGWINHDMDCDITKPLPYPDGCAKFILGEHLSEHCTHQQAWKFYEECYRILVPGGVIRIAVPDISKMWANMIPEYLKAVGPNATKRDAIRAAVFNHGHQAAWNEALLKTFLEAVGFSARATPYNVSREPALNGIDGHWKVVGLPVAQCETSVVEGVKP